MKNTLWRGRTSNVCWQSWDGVEFLVFDAESGDTHLLDRFAAQTLRQLQRNALTLEQLASQLESSSDLATETNPSKLAGQIAEVMTRFDRLGLIEPVSCA
jgi:PqqD family protein of HPr-rel-A system